MTENQLEDWKELAPLALLVLVGLCFVCMVAQSMLVLSAMNALFQPDHERALRYLKYARILPWFSNAAKRKANHVQMILFEHEGRTFDALRLADSLSQEIPSPDDANTLVNTLINAGRYSEALALKRPKAKIRVYCELLEINLAEAEYNLGKWKEAEARLAFLMTTEKQAPIVRAGKKMQMAWILAHTGRAQAALELASSADMSELPLIFQSEGLFSLAAGYLGVGQLAQAHETVTQALRIAKRASTKRNGLFLLARISAAHSNWAEVEAHCREAASHEYRGQGGAGLVLWGDALEKLARRPEAIVAWRLAIERDGQSESAREAEARLAANG